MVYNFFYDNNRVFHKKNLQHTVTSNHPERPKLKKLSELKRRHQIIGIGVEVLLVNTNRNTTIIKIREEEEKILEDWKEAHIIQKCTTRFFLLL